MSDVVTANTSEWTISRLLSWTTEHLSNKGVEDARLAGEVLLAHAAQCRRVELYTQHDVVPDDSVLAKFRQLVRRAGDHEPIAYLVEAREFFSLKMRVTADVLIPRPETETLVECAVDHCTAGGITEPMIFDLGTGSGCVTVALLSQLPRAIAIATDISAEALAVARYNATEHGVIERVTFVEADGLTLPTDVVPETGFDVILCNPPYVPSNEFNELDAVVRDYEPRGALTDESDGLTMYKILASRGAELLAPGGVVMVEIGDGQTDAVLETMTQPGQLIHKDTRKDRVTLKDRVLTFAGSG